MKIYKYLYYRLFCLWLKKKDEPANAHINAVITLTFLIFINIISIPLILMAISKKEIINLPEITSNIKVWIAGILLVAGSLNYFFLARKKYHLRIIEEFKYESKKQNERGLILVIMYLIISFGIPIYIFLFTTPK